MSVVVYSRKRKQAKKRITHLGRGMFLGAILVICTTLILPIIYRKTKQIEWQQITFSDLLRLSATDSLKVTPLSYFSLEIPKLQATAKIMANVNSGNKKEYTEALKEGVAHAAGTFLPGMGGSVTLFAHSTDSDFNVSLYNAVFYKIDELKPGDEIVIWFLGKKLIYLVTGSQVVGPKDVSVFRGEKSGEKLYLVTCTPRGTTKNRLIVEAELK